jgi:hypothetical protein
MKSGADLGCVYDHWKRYAAGTIPGADSTFENFHEITGKAYKMDRFYREHKTEL